MLVQFDARDRSGRYKFKILKIQYGEEGGDRHL